MVNKVCKFIYWFTASLLYAIYLQSDVAVALSLRNSQPMNSTSVASENLLRQVSVETDMTLSNPVQDNAPNYQCVQHAGQFLTIARTHRGMIPLIVWQSEVFGAQWTPEARCKAVSNRFQAFSNQKILQYISTGELNNYPIICISEEYGDCLSNGLLLTLEPNDNPNQVLKELFNLSSTVIRGTTKPVIDLEYILEEKTTLNLDETDADTDAILETSD